MEELQLTARFRIHEGRLERFREIAADCLRIVREQDSGTLQYDWFLDTEANECVVREAYRDSEALLEHVAHLGETFEALLEAADCTLELFGDPSPEVLEATEGLDVRVYGYLQGL